jgi:hypothetical protein
MKGHKLLIIHKNLFKSFIYLKHCFKNFVITSTLGNGFYTFTNDIIS